MNKVCVIIPVLNEEENIVKIFNNIKLIKKKLDILYIDDNSTDKTRNEIKKLKKKNKNIFFMFRNSKKGIGSAHKDGIKWCYKKKYTKILTMDCDGTHNPKYIPKLLKESELCDLVITTRFKNKNSLKDWPLRRKFLTTLRLIITKIILNINYDSSGAFRCFCRNKILLKDIMLINSNNYDFFFESIYRFDKKKYYIKEIPIQLPFRKLGKSKMTIYHIMQSLFTLIKIKFI